MAPTVGAAEDLPTAYMPCAARDARSASNNILRAELAASSLTMTFARKHVTVTQRAERFFDVSCSACAAPLTPVFSEPGWTPEQGWEDLQANGALHLNLSGSYGEFLDVLHTDDRLHLLLCTACAQQLCQDQPWLAHALQHHLGSGSGHLCRDGFSIEPASDCLHASACPAARR